MSGLTKTALDRTFALNFPTLQQAGKIGAAIFVAGIRGCVSAASPFNMYFTYNHMFAAEFAWGYAAEKGAIKRDDFAIDLTKTMVHQMKALFDAHLTYPAEFDSPIHRLVHEKRDLTPAGEEALSNLPPARPAGEVAKVSLRSTPSPAGDEPVKKQEYHGTDYRGDEACSLAGPVPSYRLADPCRKKLPTIPRMMVMMNPPGSLPGIRSFAIKPDNQTDYYRADDVHVTPCHCLIAGGQPRPLKSIARERVGAPPVDPCPAETGPVVRPWSYRS